MPNLEYVGKETGPSSEVAVEHPVFKIPQGWALKTSRRAIRFTGKVKTHLKGIFLEGEETGNKASAAAVCSRLRNQRDGSGRNIRQRRVAVGRSNSSVFQ